VNFADAGILVLVPWYRSSLFQSASDHNLVVLGAVSVFPIVTFWYITASVAATSDLAPSSRLTEVDLSRVKSSRIDDFAATSKSVQVDLDRLE
jgi:hypothetical protein